jgi:hypothetical protein
MSPNPLSELQEILNLQRTANRMLREILEDLKPPSPTKTLTQIQIQFSKGTPMPTAGPVTLTTAGQQVTASILGFDQFGNPWTGPIPPVTYAIDNPAIATSTPNPDNETDAVAAVANGTANLTATLTTTEGLALTDTEQVIVNIPAPPPPPAPVLTSIKIGFE